MQISTDKEGGSGFDFNRSRKFNRFVDNCEVLDVKAKGCFYTWRNGHDVDVFIQEGWIESWLALVHLKNSLIWKFMFLLILDQITVCFD